jgi:hypothetical protein
LDGRRPWTRGRDGVLDGHRGFGFDVQKSTDGGLTWATVGTISGVGPSALVVDPWTQTTLYLSSGTYVYKSLDGGASWNWIGDGLHEARGPHFINGLAIHPDPFAPGTIYAASDQGVFKTTDGGDVWSPVNSGLRDTSITSLAIDPWSAALYVAGTGGVHESRDLGLTWTARNAGLNPIPDFVSSFELCLKPLSCGPWLNNLVLDPWNPGTLYVGGGRAHVAKTTDGGATWSTLPVRSPMGSFVFVASNPNVLYGVESGHGDPDHGRRRELGEPP